MGVTWWNWYNAAVRAQQETSYMYNTNNINQLYPKCIKQHHLLFNTSKPTRQSQIISTWLERLNMNMSASGQSKVDRLKTKIDFALQQKLLQTSHDQTECTFKSYNIHIAYHQGHQMPEPSNRFKHILMLVSYSTLNWNGVKCEMNMETRAEH